MINQFENKGILIKRIFLRSNEIEFLHDIFEFVLLGQILFI